MKVDYTYCVACGHKLDFGCECRNPKCAHYQDPMKYRGFTIKAIEIPYRNMTHEFLHPAYDGPMDHIHAGTGSSVEDCRREIDDRISMWEENWETTWTD